MIAIAAAVSMRERIIRNLFFALLDERTIRPYPEEHRSGANIPDGQKFPIVATVIRDARKNEDRLPAGAGLFSNALTVVDIVPARTSRDRLQRLSPSISGNRNRDDP
ncbi:MAG: hypothetical protein L0I29_04655 [Hyphomicrobiales bacterium]|nr:hypothetical protein [Hyphomicrobiales bacterium]